MAFGVFPSGVGTFFATWFDEEGRIVRIVERKTEQEAMNLLKL